MKTTSVSGSGLLAVFYLLFESCLGYHILVADPQSPVVFDGSLTLQGCHYQLQRRSCEYFFDLKLDSNTGLLSTGHSRLKKSRKGVTCAVTISANCDGLWTIVYPLDISLSSHRPLHLVSQIPMNISIHESIHTENEKDISGHITNLVPHSLRSQNCQLVTQMTSRHLPTRKISTGLFWKDDNAHPFSHVSGQKKITLLQHIDDCVISDDKEVIIPNQEVILSINWRDHFLLKSLKSRSHSSKRVRRKRMAGFMAFMPRRQTVDISENLPRGSKVKYKQLRNPSNMRVEFSLQPMADRRSLEAFRIDRQTGIITTKRLLDRENMSSHTFRINAKGKGATAMCTLTVMVTDMNDNKPRFEKPEYQFTVPENEDPNANAYIGKVTASDIDIDENQIVFYSIQGLSPPDIFTIHGDGRIYLRRELDRESKAEYKFNVVATDSGTLPQHSTAKVVITVQDVNDLKPVFSGAPYHADIPENAGIHSKVIQVNATDGDAGLNGQIHYTLLSSQERNYFEIDRTTGTITLISDINFAERPEGYKLHVRAQDQGKPPKSAYCIVNVRIVDVNDHAPVFERPKYEKPISEDADINSKIITVTAHDVDDGENARISYSFVSPPSNLPFKINGASGIITLARPLDFEKQTVHTVNVRASDHGHPPKYSTVEVEIRVRGVNDNPPKFLKSLYSKRISEKAGVGRTILTVDAVDLDRDSTLEYSITEGNYGNKFQITTHGNKGLIALTHNLNFNERRWYLLTVKCSDGELSGYTKVRINVTDANTHIPEFDKSIYDVKIDEGVDIGTTVVQVHATDQDVGENAEITYSLQDSSDKFRLDPVTGYLKTIAQLDFEEESVLELTVIAEDKGIPPGKTSAQVSINLRDVNDNAPKFDKQSYQASVAEDVRVGTPVETIQARDIDSGKNGQVVYTFDNGNDGNGYFSIDRNSGIIRTALKLDREHLASYDLIAYAEDRGTSTQRTAVRVHVTVTDVDDNPPTFEKDVLVFNVSEDSHPGSVVAKLVAHDLDEDGHSQVSYELVSLESMQLWDLNIDTGELRPTFQLDYEEKSSYSLIVFAYSGVLASEAKVIINLIDVNDNPPELKPFQVVFNNYRTDKPYAFPIGPVGRVPAYDPDVSSVLKYRFTPGTNNSLLLLNETSGELRLSSKLDNDREFEATFMVEVSDGKYNASAECLLKVVPITDEMLINSVTVRMEQMSQEDFLSNAMKQFTHGLGQILNISSQDVYIFNVQNDTDVSPHAVVNVSFSAKHADGHFLSTKQLQEQVYLNRSVLTNYSMQNVMPFDDNICLREPCENYMRCVSALYFNSTAPFISTGTILFRPIHPVSGLRCKCPEGFAGVGCQNEVNMCHASKCKNGGKCVSIEGGYVCRCSNLYAGRHCEVDLTGGQCSSANGVCKNNAKCQQFPAGGLRCDCRMNGLVQDELTKFCELRGRSFQRGDFIMFSGITRQWRFTLQLSFVTREKDGLLLYNGRFNHEHDYLALEIVDGQVQLNFSTGQDYTVVRPFVIGGVADGKWHTVEVQYRNKPKSEVLGKEYIGPSNIKVVTVTVDPATCDPAMLDKWNKNLGNYTCTQKAEQGGTKSSLDLTTPLLVGGVPNLPEQYQVHSRYFTGCIRDLHIDEQMVDMSSYVANYGSQPGCKSMRDHCVDNPCPRPHATCENVWGAYKCNCEDGFGGQKCKRVQTVHNFRGSGCLKINSLSILPKPVVYPWSHTVAVRTTHTEGTILHMFIGRTGEIKMKLQGGKLKYLVKVGTRSKYTLVNAVLNDGDWHEIVAEWKKIGQNVFISINIDTGFALGHLTTNQALLLPSESRFANVFLGGSWTGSRVEDGFVGCLQGLEFEPNSRIGNIPASRLSPTNPMKPVREGCRVPNPCDGNKCPRNSNCISHFDTYTCQCHKGRVGNKCVNVCTLNPCHNGGKCILDQQSKYGYRCQCKSDMFYGRTCEHRYQYPCPSGWWAGDNHICTPCDCSIEKNFDPACGSHGGKCVCLKNHYYISEKNLCLPCGCYAVGSEGLDCEDETGQCKCRSGVIGKKCNRCSSNFAEVVQTKDACKVVYDSCPRSYVDDVLWIKTRFGETIPAQCPKNSVGYAKRECDEKDGWLTPNLSNCTSKPYDELRRDIKNLDMKKQYFEEHGVRMSMDAVTRLYEASNSTSELHQGDVLLSYELVMKILSSQNNLSGFDLTASRRKDFNMNNADKWKSIQHNGKHKVNSAKLMESYEGYLAALTRSMLTMWEKSIREKSAFLQLLVESLPNDEYAMLNLTNDGKSGVTITMFPPDEALQKKLPKNGTVGVIEFTTIGKILPLSYHDNRLDMRRPVKGFINSAVVSVVTHDRVDRMPPGHKLIALTFPLLQNNGSNPQCVFWNFTNSGGWSQKGCDRRQHNKTHVTCTCSHLTSFAVLSDEEVVSVLDDLPVKIALYGSVAFIIICILVCVGCTLFLQDVTSNHSKIHCNFGVSVLLSELFFSCGIMLTTNAYACMASAIFIHFFFMSTLAWVFVEGLHLYRMLTEKRDVDRGNMRIYYLMGWGIPGIITALSVGLDAKGFGNANFCWIRTDHLLVWSFVGPLLFCCIIYIIIFLLSMVKYFTSKLPDEKLSEMRNKLKSSFFLLPFVCALWGLALFAVNENTTQYYYIFSIVNVSLGILMILCHCVFNKEVRSAIRSVKERRWQKAELTITKQHLLKTSFSTTPDASNGPRRIQIGTSLSSTSTAHTPSRKNPQNSTLFHDRALSEDSESDDSDSSIGTLASSHSSDEEVDDRPMYLNVNNSNSWQFKNGHLPMRRPHNGGLVVHSTPKEGDTEEDHQQPSFCNGTPSARSDPFVTSLPTVSESNLEEEEEEEQIEEPHYLAINSTRKDGKKLREENIELLPMQETDSLPRRGILKNGRKSKPPTPVRGDSLQRKPSPISMTTSGIEETALLRKTEMMEKMEKVAVIQNSSVSSSHDQLL